MSLFKDMLGSGESLFKNSVALDYDYIPKLIPYRENEQFRVASCIKPLLQRRNGRNIIVSGKPGVGKTVAIRHVLEELEEQTDDIIPIYINCWQKNTTYKIVIALCDLLGYKFTQNKKTDELFKIVKGIINKKSLAIVLDEIDKLEDYDFLYMVLEEIYRKSMIVITNYREWIINLDGRIKSRLIPETFEFRPYNHDETRGILEERKKYAFVENVWDDGAFLAVAKKAHEHADVRIGLFLLRESGNAAEDNSSKKISMKHVETAVSKLDAFSLKKTEDLDSESKDILDMVRKNPDKRIGDLYKLFQKNGGKTIYKTFQRRIAKLADNGYISATKVTGGINGEKGTTTLVKPLKDATLSDF
ncbi:MAG: AAA family ATPase [archaeon]